jgi:hypothetical protein
MTEAAPPTEAPRGAPAVGWASGPLGAVQAANREIGRQTALRARAVAEFAASRPASADRPAGTPGAMSSARRATRPTVLADVSEWATQELVVALSITSTAAQNLLERSLTLVHRLPRTLVALESGLIHDGHLWHLLDKVGPIADTTIRARVEREALNWVAGRSVTTPPQLARRVRRSVLRHDAAAAAQRLAKALRERGVFVRADRHEGMAVFEALLTVPEAQALLDALERYADALDDPDDGRTRGQKMVDCLLDLVLRPGEHDHAPVRADLTVVAGVPTLHGNDQPGEIGGEPVPAEMVRALARALGLLPGATEPGDPGATQPDPPGTAVLPAVERCPDDPPVDAPAAELQAADERWWAEVEARALTGEWRGEEDPPPDVMERWWALESEQHEPPPLRPSSSYADGSSSGPTADAARWADADHAVERAGTALLELQRATSRAVQAAEAAAHADAAVQDERRQGSGGRIGRARGALDALRQATGQQREALAALLDRGAGGNLVDRPRIAVVDELTGALLCLTDSDELRRHATCGARACRREPWRCDHDLHDRPGLGPPGPSAGYRPGAALDRFVRVRDRRCRFPGCRRRVPQGGELDHDRPWPDGSTRAANLVGYCTGHHRGKHQAPGWRHHLAEDGTLTVTTPTGLTATTTPPPF